MLMMMIPSCSLALSVSSLECATTMSMATTALWAETFKSEIPYPVYSHLLTLQNSQFTYIIHVWILSSFRWYSATHTRTSHTVYQFILSISIRMWIAISSICVPLQSRPHAPPSPAPTTATTASVRAITNRLKIQKPQSTSSKLE